MEELQKKIEKKERDHARRHEEHLEETRAKAFEMSIRHCSSQVGRGGGNVLRYSGSLEATELWC